METLVVMKNQQAVTSSLQVAETFGKAHRSVMLKIRDLTAQNRAVEKMFVQSTYLNKQGHSQPMYYMNRDGFTLLVVGFTGKKAMDFKLKYIEAFNAMESQIKNQGSSIMDMLSNPDNAIALLTEYKNNKEQLEVVTKENEALKPKALFADAVSTSNTSILVGELAKLLKQNGIDIGQNRLFKWLRNNGYLISREGADHNMPTQYAMNLKLFRVKETSIEHSDGHVTVSKTPKVTGKGQQFFVNKFLNQKEGVR